MPDVTLINRFGRAVQVPGSLVDDAIMQGCRYPDSTDWRTMHHDEATFRLPRIDPAPPMLGEREMLVFGSGPSAGAWVDGSYRIGVNVRADGPEYKAVVALDQLYWDSMWDARPSTDTYYKYTCAGPKVPKGYNITNRRFWLPLHPLKSQTERHGNKNLLIAIKGAITAVNITGIAAMLLAREISDGPIILAGFDLGMAYRQTQEWKFRAIAPCFKNVFCHPEMDGPLREVFPTWEGSARKERPEANVYAAAGECWRGGDI